MSSRNSFFSFIPWLFVAMALGFVVSSMIPSRYEGGYDIGAFGRLPVQEGGRIKPLDTVGRNALRMLRAGKQTVRLEERKGSLNGVMWLMEMMMRPEVANSFKVFRIDNSEVMGLMGKKQEEGKYFSFDDIKSHLETVVENVGKINPDPALRTPYEAQLNKLYGGLMQYNQIMQSFTTGSNPKDLELEYATWFAIIESGFKAIQSQSSGAEYDKVALERFGMFADSYLQMAKVLNIGIVPPFNDTDDWANLGQGLLDVLVNGEISPVIVGYAKLVNSYRDGKPELFNETLVLMNQQFDGKVSQAKLSFEQFFNEFEPFYISIVFYLMAFILVAISWMVTTPSWRQASYVVLIVALVMHTFCLIARMYIHGRPPVTNLYSSAIFVGWGSVLLGAFFESFHRMGLGTAVAGLLGFSTLIIAHNLGLQGDTLEMMSAVLDSNFWLWTHVVVVTLGYSAMFLSGSLGIIYIIRGVKRQSSDNEVGQSLQLMAYGAVAFATIFSFVGTMLGGIWADQSWGRFWGWDPKENGAILIVLWCAVMLHARWGGLVKTRGFMVMAVFGNIVTSWSWFGTNMLGVGFHSYGFMDKALWALAIFMISQVFIMFLPFLRKFD